MLYVLYEEDNVTREWKIEYMPDALDAGWPGWPDIGDENEPPDCWGLWLCEDGVPVRLIGEDGGEPEDQTMVRRWAWVRDACNEAYAMGLADGRAAQASAPPEDDDL